VLKREIVDSATTMTADVQVQGEVVRKVLKMTSIDKNAIRDAYEDVRDDKSQDNWAVFKYEGNQVILAAKGQSFEDFKSQFNESDRAFAYLRLMTGDEMSKRAKFLMLTWVGSSVSAIKKAKMSTDKALVKEVIKNFAVELMIETEGELDEQVFITELTKAGGANYGTGARD